MGNVNSCIGRRGEECGCTGNKVKDLIIGENMKMLNEKRIDFMLSTNYKILRHSTKFSIYLMFIISVMGGHCEYWVRGSEKN